MTGIHSQLPSGWLPYLNDGWECKPEFLKRKPFKLLPRCLKLVEGHYLIILIDIVMMVPITIRIWHLKRRYIVIIRQTVHCTSIPRPYIVVR